MAKMTERALRARDAKRDIGAELLASVRDMKAGKVGRIHRVPLSAIAEARARSGLSQQRFADLLGVSPRTVQEWSKGVGSLPAPLDRCSLSRQDVPTCCAKSLGDSRGDGLSALTTPLMTLPRLSR